MKNKKAEVNTYIIIASIVIIGLFAFFLVRFFFFRDTPESLNVTKINDSTTSTSIQYVSPATGGINVSNGMDLTLKNPVENVSINNNTANKTLIKVIYPNSTMTPGDIMSSNITEICISGYSDSVRDVSESDRHAVYVEYLLSPEQPEGAFEIDHLIPLSLGGSNDIKNLWPQPAEPKPGYKEKDRLETYYHKQVCDGNMELREAQVIMANNWFQGYVDVYNEGGFNG